MVQVKTLQGTVRKKPRIQQLYRGRRQHESKRPKSRNVTFWASDLYLFTNQQTKARSKYILSSDALGKESITRGASMTRSILSAVAVLLVAVPAFSQDSAKSRLDNSPRHHEWVKVKHGNREVQCFLAFPEVKDKAKAVVVIHEIFGLTEWVR